MPDARPYRRVLALIRFDASDERVARKALALARLNGAQLDLLHLVEPDSALDGGYARAGNPAATARALEHAALRRLEFLASRLGAEDACCHASYGPLRQGFSRHLCASPAELVVTTEPLPYLAGAHDLLVLAAHRSRASGGLLNMLTNLLAPWRGIARV